MEMRRVARRQVIFVFDPVEIRRFWAIDYWPNGPVVAVGARPSHPRGAWRDPRHRRHRIGRRPDRLHRRVRRCVLGTPRGAPASSRAAFGCRGWRSCQRVCWLRARRGSRPICVRARGTTATDTCGTCPSSTPAIGSSSAAPKGPGARPRTVPHRVEVVDPNLGCRGNGQRRMSRAWWCGVRRTRCVRQVRR